MLYDPIFYSEQDAAIGNGNRLRTAQSRLFEAASLIQLQLRDNDLTHIFVWSQYRFTDADIKLIQWHHTLSGMRS